MHEECADVEACSFPGVSKMQLTCIPATDISKDVNGSFWVQCSSGKGWHLDLMAMQILRPANPGVSNTQLPAEISSAIDKAFGNYSSFVSQFNSSALSVFGSGEQTWQG